MFKQCRKCGVSWPSRDAFLKDASIEVLGYQVFFDDLKEGMILFNHSCNTTMAIHTQHFLDLYDGPFHSGRKPDGRQCPGRCVNENILSPCSPECRCAFISDLLKIIREYRFQTNELN